MRLCIAYTVFGTELLSQSIKNIIDVVDEVIICYQEVSNTGIHKPFEWSHEYNPKVHFVKYNTFRGLDIKEQERRKHQFMVDYTRKIGCTHFILSACDHFYDPKEVAEQKAHAGQYDVTFTSMFTYFKHPTWQLDPIENYYMPFICKLPAKVLKTTKYPLLVDPSVRFEYKDSNWYLFRQDMVMLHHFSMVRHDMKAKFANAASAIGRKNPVYLQEYENYDINENPGIQYFKGRKVKIVPNYFNL